MYRGLREAQNARVVYLDMNAFFASIEQQRNPQLRGKPVAAVSHIGNTGTVLASSYEAKALGVITGMRLRESFQLCPSLIPIETHGALYRSVHVQFMEILRDLFGPEVIARSIDEAVLFLPPNWYGSESAHELALKIKKRFREELGECIRCSIGIAPNSLLGKLATNLQNPDGLVEITLENTPDILSKLPLTALPGIAKRAAARLEAWNIHTPLDLYNASPVVLRQQFGIWGQYWWWRLHGYETDSHSSPLKSMSHQHALKKWATSRFDLTDTLYRMADRLIHRLRRNNFQCKYVFIYLGCKGGPGLLRDHHFDTHTQSYAQLLKAITRLFNEFPAQTEFPIRKISIGFDQLIQAGSGWQMDLFHDLDKEEGLSAALEKVRAKHGFEAIQRGNVITLDKAVTKEEVGFGRIKDR
jgi:DNA polymerase-4